MGLNEADTRAKLIDPSLYQRGWIETYIKREETAGSIEIIGGKTRKKGRGRLDYTLRIQAGADTHPVAIALVEAKAAHLPPGHGLEQAKGYQLCKRFNVPFLEFRDRWVSRQAREDLLRELVEGGRSPKVVQLLREMGDYDLFDVLGQLGYDMAPLTRMLRFATFAQQQADWLKAMPPRSARTVEAIAQQFVFEGTDGLENQQLFQVPSIMQAGGMPALKLLGKPLDVLQDMKIRLFAA